MCLAISNNNKFWIHPEYCSFGSNIIVDDQGNNLESRNDTSVEECKENCRQTKNCKSFSYCPFDRSCHLKDKSLESFVSSYYPDTKVKTRTRTTNHDEIVAWKDKEDYQILFQNWDTIRFIYFLWCQILQPNLTLGRCSWCCRRSCWWKYCCFRDWGCKLCWSCRGFCFHRRVCSG